MPGNWLRIRFQVFFKEVNILIGIGMAMTHISIYLFAYFFTGHF